MLLADHDDADHEDADQDEALHDDADQLDALHEDADQEDADQDEASQSAQLPPCHALLLHELALKRATTVRDLLVAAGFDGSTIEVTSHGEADLMIPTPDETPEPRNRRVEITVR